MKPTAKGQINKANWKVSIQDSIESMIIEVTTVSDVCKRIEAAKLQCISRKWKLQPFIFKIENQSDPYYCVVFDDMFYRFEEFVNAFDICLKLFFILNLEYPVACRKVWVFIQKHIYTIDTPYDISSPDISDLQVQLILNT